jgi:hypothetical protein
LKPILIAFSLLTTSVLYGQATCIIDSVPGSNEIVYNVMEVEKLIDFSKYNAVFYGEGHVKYFEPVFKLRFIKHLNQQFGFRDIFMEIGYAAAYFYNRYLQTGDTTILTGYHLTYGQSSYRDFWYQLYQYNKVQPSDRKIFIHGVDFERTEIYKLLEELRRKDAAIPAHLQTVFSIVSRRNTDASLSAFDTNFQTELSAIRAAFSNHTDDFKAIYGDHFKIVAEALTNPAPLTTRVEPRNKAWQENFSSIIAENRIQKFIAFFGKAHTSYDNNTSPNVTLQKNTTFTNRIITIAGIYHHFVSAGYMGPDPKVFEYGSKGEEEIYQKYAGKTCRASLLATEGLSDKDLKKKSDCVLFAKDIVVDK